MKPKHFSLGLIPKQPDYICELSFARSNLRESSSVNRRNSLIRLDTVKSSKKFTFNSPFQNDSLLKKVPYNTSPGSSFFFPSAKKTPNDFFRYQKAVPKKITLEEDAFDYEKRLDNVCRILSRIFNGDQINLERNNLNEHEKKLIYCVLDKVFEKLVKSYEKKKRPKYKLILKTIEELRNKEDYQQLIDTILHKPIMFIKRKEEKIKFVLKNTINYFRRQFLNNNSLKLSKTNNLVFLEYYFKEHKDKFNMDFDCFSDPLNSSLMVNTRFKTLSDQYFKVIFGVRSFRNAFFNHLEKRFRECYLKSVLNKFRKMFICLYDNLAFKTEIQYREAIENQIKILKNMKVLKMPWVVEEVDDALDVFKRKIIGLMDGVTTN